MRYFKMEKLQQYFGKYDLPQDPDKYFSAVVNIAMRDYNLPVKDIAEKCGCSFPTVERWAKGINTPYRLMQPKVLELIVELIEKQPK